jgi:hypothetical protein
VYELTFDDKFPGLSFFVHVKDEVGLWRTLQE